MSSTAANPLIGTSDGEEAEILVPASFRLESVFDPDGDAVRNRRRHGVWVNDLCAEVGKFGRFLVGEFGYDLTRPVRGEGRR